MKNTYKRSLIIISIVFLVLLLGCCAPQPQSNESSPQATALPTQTASPTMAATQINIDGYQPITPQNIQDMELLYELGIGQSYDAALSPDGKNIAVLTKYKIIVYDRNTFEEIYTVPVEIPSNSVITFNPDGDQIVYSNTHGIIFINTINGTFIDSFLLGSSFDNITGINFIPDNDRLLVTGLNYDSLYGVYCFALYDFDGNKLFEREYANMQWTYSYKFLDKQRTALLIYRNDFQKIIPLQTFIIENKTGNVLAAAINAQNYKSPGETTFFGAINLLPTQAEIEAWVQPDENLSKDIQNSDCVDLLKYDTQNILEINEKTILGKLKARYYAHDDTAIRIEEIDLQTCTVIRHIDFPSFQYNAIFSPDDYYLVQNNSFNTYVWEMSDGSMWLDFPQRRTNNATRIAAFNSNGSSLLLYPYVNEYDTNVSPSIAILNMQTGGIRNEIRIEPEKPVDIHSTFSPDIMIIEFPSRLSLWNISSPEHLVDIPKGPFILDPSRNGLWVLSSDGNVYQAPELYDLHTGALVKQFFHLDRKSNTELFLLEDNSILEITFDGDSTEKDFIQIDIETGKLIDYLYRESTSDNNHIDIHGPELSKWFYAAPDNKAGYTYLESTQKIIGPFLVEPSTSHNRWPESNAYRFWNLETNEYLGFITTDFPISDILISPNHYYLTAIGSDGIIRIFGVKEQ